MWVTNGEVTWLRDDGLTKIPSHDLIKELISAQRFAARVETRTGDLTAVFDLEGIDTAVKPIAEACEQEW